MHSFCFLEMHGIKEDIIIISNEHSFIAVKDILDIMLPLIFDKKILFTDIVFFNITNYSHETFFSIGKNMNDPNVFILQYHG